MNTLPEDIENIIIDYKHQLEKLEPRDIFKCNNLKFFNLFKCDYCEKVYSIDIKCENEDICFNCEEKQDEKSWEIETIQNQNESCCIL